MTAQYLQRWLGHHAFYRMELARFEGRSTTPGGTAGSDNPDQRIQEDVNQFTSYTVSLPWDCSTRWSRPTASFVGILVGAERGLQLQPGRA